MTTAVPEWKSLLLILAIPLCAMVWPGYGARLIGKGERTLGKVAYSRWAFLGFGLATLALSCSFLLFLWLPEPRVHDEFSYLLQADTFVHGRLANPAHPMWKWFENFHIIQHPTYASKYPPGQGLFLALGKVLGHPVVGVWISTALAGSAVFWMLSSIFPRPWALAGAVLGLLNPQVLAWDWCYWGGSVALTGGALVLGGTLRTLKGPEIFASAMMGLGMGILSLSRPFEGLVLSALLSGVCTFAVLRRNWDRRAYWTRFVIPMSVLVLPALLFQAYYNFRVTLSPIKMPYSVYEATYSQSPAFLWQSRRVQAPDYNNAQMARLYAEWVDPIYYWQHTLRGFWRYFKEKTSMYAPLVWNGFILVLIAPVLLRLRKTWMPLLMMGLLVVAFIVTFGVPVWAWPHYSSPFYPLIVVLLVFGLRELRSWHWGHRRWGRWAGRGIFVFLCIYGVVEFVSGQKKTQDSWHYERAALQAKLQADGKKHLIIVKYGPAQDIHESWIWNSADIDHAAVVWASDLGEAENVKLFDYFKGYQINTLRPGSADSTKEPQP
jgi:hypothetical protein